MSVQTYREATAFLVGFDSAVMGELLKGFREWLIVRVNGGYNMAFPWLVEMLMAKAPLTENDDKNRAEIEFLMATLDEFLTARSESDGLRRIFFEYERWLTRQRGTTLRVLAGLATKRASAVAGERVVRRLVP